MTGKAPLFDWDDLRIFHALVSAGSMSGAARKLGIGQPTVSRRLDQLETRIGARLVTRLAEGIELTDVGERIWTQVQIMQSTAGDIERIAHQADRADSDRVRLSAPEGVAGYWIARHLTGFVEANPNISLEISTRTDGENTLEQCDIALQMSESKRMSHVATELATLHYVPFASRHYLDTYGPPKGLADVLMHRTADIVSYREQQTHWPREAAAIKQMLNPSLTTDSAIALIEAVKAGAVISLLPTYAAKVEPSLIHLDLELQVPITLWMVYHPEQRKVTRSRKAIDWLREIFDSSRYPWFRRDYVPPSEFSDVETVHIRGERPRPRLV
ncbi:LysR family transcriptional regulator [Alkalicaulis satelles]|uniref:LysR family transcriptional regulator n=1 Tax=Alkalicaulis satelles TaxID=2609175 RepID=A0A5M6Z8R5_9PROT|nr:LysR family transcriptional regulator [Alkalicaulis satelles]KAA5801039.1 LysR family transcriptional regulator [Alkalicaulis satelles]